MSLLKMLKAKQLQHLACRCHCDRCHARTMRASPPTAQSHIRYPTRVDNCRLKVSTTAIVLLGCLTLRFIATWDCDLTSRSCLRRGSRIVHARRALDTSESVESASSSVSAATSVLLPEKHGVLVLYVYSNTDPLYPGNLRFFVREGVYASDSCHFVIVIQEGNGVKREEAALPRLPRNAEYVRHPNECYDWGTFGWYLTSHSVEQYSYFVFLNSSVRGPFMPAYLRGKVKWVDLLLAKLSGDVKLVGSTISCHEGPDPSDRSPIRKNPHVQSYLVATDHDGLRVLLEDKMVFQCHQELNDAIHSAELGSSHAILSAGYNLDCLMLRYQGVDWRNHTNWDCNMHLNPYLSTSANDGIAVSPMEVMFLKYKDRTYSRHPPFQTALKYEQWMLQQLTHGQVNVSENDYVANREKHSLPQLLYHAARGKDCFDADYYLEMNTDLQGVIPSQGAWQHYVMYGQFESRPASYNCEADYHSMHDAVVEQSLLVGSYRPHMLLPLELPGRGPIRLLIKASQA